MIKSILSSIRRALAIRKANRAAFLAQKYYMLAGQNTWSAIGDHAFELYKHYRQKAAAHLAEAAEA